MSIKERIKILIKDKKIKQVEFANKINVDPSYISKLLSSKSTAMPSDRLINDICREFNVNKEWLLNGIGEPYIEESTDTLISDALAEITLTNNEKLKEAVIKLCELDDPYLDLVLNLINGLNENKK